MEKVDAVVSYAMAITALPELTESRSKRITLEANDKPISMTTSTHNHSHMPNNRPARCHNIKELLLVALTPVLTHMQHTVGTMPMSPCGTLIPCNNNSNNNNTEDKV